MIDFKNQFLKATKKENYYISSTIFNNTEKSILFHSKPCLTVLQSGSLKYLLNDVKEIELSENQCFIFDGGNISRIFSNSGSISIIEHRIFHDQKEVDFAGAILIIAQFIPDLTILNLNAPLTVC